MLCGIEWYEKFIEGQINNSWCTVRLQQPISLQLVKKLPEFYGTRGFITAFTKARHIPWPKPYHSMSDPNSRRSFNIILQLNLGFPSGLFTSGFSHQKPVWNSPVYHTCHMTRPSHSSWFYHSNNNNNNNNNNNFSSLRSLLHSPVTSCMLGPNTFPSILLLTLNIPRGGPLRIPEGDFLWSCRNYIN